MYDINNYEAITEQLGRLHKKLTETQPTTVHTIGGDCGLEIVPVSYLNLRYPRLGVIWFDAHADINRPCDSPSCNFHGMPLRTLLGEGEGEGQMAPLLFSTIKTSQIHYVGLRDMDAMEQERIDKGNIYVQKKLRITELVETLHQKSIAQLYLHFDFDCLEPSEYKETYYQVPKGITIGEAESCIKTLKDNFNIVGTSALESVTTDIQKLRPIAGILDLLLK
ncbi:MAG: arginase family protein [Saonia sp.]